MSRHPLPLPPFHPSPPSVQHPRPLTSPPFGTEPLLQPPPLPFRGHHSARSTRTSQPLTWGQVKMLTKTAEEIVREQGSQPAPWTMFLAILAIISCQVLTVSGSTVNWAYVPRPPVLQPVTWDSKPVPVYNNSTFILDGMSSSFIDHQSNYQFFLFRPVQWPSYLFCT